MLKRNDVETVCLLSKLHETKYHINVKVDMDELDLTSAEAKVTYKEIQNWMRNRSVISLINRATFYKYYDNAFDLPAML